MSIGFVIGNGTSRKSIDLPLLAQHGTTYGCNALYRDFSPDHLICVDLKMIQEIHQSGYPRTHPVWSYNRYQLHRFDKINYFDTDLQWSSGPTALWFASSHKHDLIYIIGFDYTGHHNNTKFNNIYADTPNYKKSIQPATFFHNWLKQTITVITNNPMIQYKRVVDDMSYTCDELSQLPNYKNLHIDAFVNVSEQKLKFY